MEISNNDTLSTLDPQDGNTDTLERATEFEKFAPLDIPTSSGTASLLRSQELKAPEPAQFNDTLLKEKNFAFPSSDAQQDRNILSSNDGRTTQEYTAVELKPDAVRTKQPTIPNLLNTHPASKLEQKDIEPPVTKPQTGVPPVGSTEFPATRLSDGRIRISVPVIGQNITITPVKVDLGSNPSKTLADALKQKQEADSKEMGGQVKEYNAVHGTNYKTVEELSRGVGYYGSPLHRAYAQIASARSNGTIPPEWFMQADPFGGFAGGSPGDIQRQAAVATLKKMPGGMEWYNSPEGKEFQKKTWQLTPENLTPLLKTGIMHDADIMLGRFFGAGPLSPIHGSPDNRNSGVGVIEGDPTDPVYRKKFEEAGKPIPNYLYGQFAHNGWQFDDADPKAPFYPSVRSQLYPDALDTIGDIAKLTKDNIPEIIISSTIASARKALQNKLDEIARNMPQIPSTSPIVAIARD